VNIARISCGRAHKEHFALQSGRGEFLRFLSTTIRSISTIVFVPIDRTPLKTAKSIPAFKYSSTAAFSFCSASAISLITSRADRPVQLRNLPHAHVRGVYVFWPVSSCWQAHALWAAVLGNGCRLVARRTTRISARPWDRRASRGARECSRRGERQRQAQSRRLQM
jgi:hypothetical protein